MSTEDAGIVLVVDDNDTARYTKSRILTHAGFAVIEAATGREALAMIIERKPRLVLLDVHLPDISGWDICQRIKSDPAMASILVLQVSATYTGEADRVRALEGGADGCLTEPIEPPVLVATVRALLRARRAEDALRDVLEREQAARAAAEAANRTKDEFLATLSHELRSPLNAILTWVGLLRTGKVDEARTVKGLEAIERNTRLQAKLIEDLLDVSRIISGKMRLDIGLVDLTTVVESALDSVRPAAEAKGVRIHTVVDPTVGPVSGDTARLQQVIWNLLSNAVKFTPKAGRIDLAVEGLDSIAQITVRDSGKGIDPAFIPHIFERFRQADSSSTRTEGGLGLGLAIVRHLVELHGGTVQAESAGLDAGSTFMVRLPLPAVRFGIEKDDQGNIVRPHAGPSNLRRLDGLRILVVDDEPDARDAIGAVLEQCGAQVMAAPSVVAALESLANMTPDVVVSDIAMPMEDGYALIQGIRSRGPERGGDVPALALTAYAGAEDRRRISASGFQAHLTKPIEAAALVGAVARLAGLT